MTSITIELPDDLAERAASLGLFTPEKIKEWLEVEARRAAAATLAASLATPMSLSPDCCGKARRHG